MIVRGIIVRGIIVRGIIVRGIIVRGMIRMVVEVSMGQGEVRLAVAGRMGCGMPRVSGRVGVDCLLSGDSRVAIIIWFKFGVIGLA